MTLMFSDSGGGIVEAGPASTSEPRLWVGLTDEPRRMLLDKRTAESLRNYLTYWLEEQNKEL